MSKDAFGEEYFRELGERYGIRSGESKVYGDVPYNEALLRLILEYKSGGELLEIGCAYGYFLRYAEKYFETYGMDISDWAIDRAREVTEHTQLIVGGIETDLEVWFKDKKFDVIVALDVLEHMESPKKVLETIYSILSDDGSLLFRVPNLSSIIFKFYSLINRKERWHGYRDKTHVSLLPVKEWGHICTNVDFEYKLIAHTPTRFAKKQICRVSPRRIFLPSIFRFANESILFLCKKKNLK